MKKEGTSTFFLFRSQLIGNHLLPIPLLIFYCPTISFIIQPQSVNCLHAMMHIRLGNEMFDTGMFALKPWT